MALDAIDQAGLELALDEARKGAAEGGIPIGSALLYRLDPGGSALEHGQEIGLGGLEYVFLGKGHNRRIQKSSPTLHGEMDALENAGRLKADVYRRSTIVRDILISRCQGLLSSFIKLTCVSTSIRL